MKGSRLIGNGVLLLAGLASALLTWSCQDFFGTEDLREVIREDTLAATAPEIQVSLRAESDNMGTPNPYGTQTMRVGLEYAVTTTVGKDYTFLRWTHSGEEGDVTFADDEAISTTMVIHNEVEELRVEPTFDRRPYPVTWDPYSGNTGVVTNATITVTFNEPLDQSSLRLAHDGTVQVTTFSRTSGSTGDPVHMEDDLTLALIGNVLTIAPKPGHFFAPFHTVIITMAPEILDVSGNGMSEQFSWFFSTGSGEDSDPPVITDYRIRNTAGILSESGVTDVSTSGANVQLRITAVDELQEVWYLRVIETPDGGSTTETSDVFSGQYDYSLKTPADQWTTVQIRVADSLENWSTGDETSGNTRRIYLDGTDPTVASVVLAGGAAYTSTSTVDVAVGAVDGTGTAVTGYRATESSNAPTSWESSAPATVTLSAGNGTKTVYLHVRDASGRTAYATDAITVDTTPPTISGVTVQSGAQYATTSTVSLGMGTIDGTGSPITGYRATQSATVPGTWDGTAPTGMTLVGGDGFKTVYLHVRDSAGNTAYATDTITLDTTGPAITSFPLPAATNTAAQSFTITATDATSGMASYEVGGGGVQSGFSSTTSSESVGASFTLLTPDGAKEVTLTVSDAAGNITSGSYSTTLDTLVPTVASLALDGGALYTDSASVGLTVGATDGTGTAVAAYNVTQNASAPTSGWVGSPPATHTLTGGEGLNTVYYWVRDAAGNVASVSDQITLDTQVPTISGPSVAGGATYAMTATVAVDFGTVDDIGTGVMHYALTESAGEPTSGWVTTEPVTYSFSGADGPRTVHFWVRDAAGNSASASDAVTLDLNAPTIVSFPVPAATADPALTIAVESSDAGSGIASYDISGPDVALPFSATTSDTTVTASITLTSGSDGAKSVPLTVTDAAGRSTTQTETVVLDRASPTITGFTVAGGNDYTNTLTVAVATGTVDGTGTTITGWKVSESPSVPATWDGSAPATYTFVTGTNETKSVYLHVRDAVGNTATAMDQVTLDTVVPVISGAGLTADAMSVSGLSTTDDGVAAGSLPYTLSYGLTGGSGGSFDGTEMTGLTQPADGTSNDYTITATDPAGNQGSAVVRHSANANGSAFTATLNP